MALADLGSDVPGACLLAHGVLDTDSIGYKSYTVTTYVTHGGLLAILSVLLIKRGIPRLRASLLLMASVSKQNNFLDDGGNRERETKMIAKEVWDIRKDFLITSGPIFMCILMAMAILVNLVCDQLAILRNNTHTWVFYWSMAPVHIAIAAIILWLALKPTSVLPRSLDVANIVFSCCISFACLWPNGSPRDPEFYSGAIPLLLLQTFFSLMCGNAPLSNLLIVVSTLVAQLQWTSCVGSWQGNVLLLPFGAGLMGVSWALHFWLRALAGLNVRESIAMNHASVVEMLLSRTCDAVVFLGPRLEVVKGAEQLSCLLMRSGDPQRFANRALIEVIVEADQAKVVDALTSANATDDDIDTERGRQAGVVSARLRDAAGIPVPVQIFHACLGHGDEGVRVAGIKEDQDQDANQERGSPRFRSGFGGSEEARLDPDASSDSGGSSGPDALAGMEEKERQARAAAALEIDSQCHVSFDVFEADANGNSYPITSSSPSFTLLFGTGLPGRFRTMMSLFSNREQHKFDDWVTAVYQSPEYHETGFAQTRWVSFDVASLSRLGVRLVAHCSLAPCDLHRDSMRLRLHELYWRAQRHQPRLQPTELRRSRTRRSGSRRSGALNSPGTPPTPPRASTIGNIQL